MVGDPTAHGLRLDVGVLAGVRSRRFSDIADDSHGTSFSAVGAGLTMGWTHCDRRHGAVKDPAGGLMPKRDPVVSLPDPQSDRGFRGTSVDSERHIRTTIGGCGPARHGIGAERQSDHVGGVHAGVALGAASNPRPFRHPIESIRPGSLRPVGAAHPQRGVCAGWSPLPILRGAGREHRPRHTPLARWGTHVGERGGGVSPLQSPQRFAPPRRHRLFSPAPPDRTAEVRVGICQSGPQCGPALAFVPARGIGLSTTRQR